MPPLVLLLLFLFLFLFQFLFQFLFLFPWARRRVEKEPAELQLAVFCHRRH